MTIILPDRQAGFATGDPNLALPGSGLAVPGGVDSVFEYNGFVFNDRSTVDKYRITEIDGLSDADVRDARDVNPGAHGETAFQSWYGGRTITFTGRIEAHTLQKLRDMQQAIRQAFNDLEEHPLKINPTAGTPDQRAFINAKKVQPLTMREAQTNWNHFRDFIVAIRASNPRIKSIVSLTESASITNGASVVFTVLNNGNFRAQPIISISGGVSNITVRNLANREFIKLNGTIANGERVVIDVERRLVTNQDDENEFRMVDITSGWPELDPGENQIEVTASGVTGSPTITMTWRHTWM